jgi:cell division protein FtsB
MRPALYVVAAVLLGLLASALCVHYGWATERVSTWLVTSGLLLLLKLVTDVAGIKKLDFDLKKLPIEVEKLRAQITKIGLEMEKLPLEVEKLRLELLTLQSRVYPATPQETAKYAPGELLGFRLTELDDRSLRRNRGQ